jgi:FkbM family methyltransferase
MKHYGYQIENEIFWSGLISGWEKKSIHLWIELCKQSDIIFDIGANTGVYALIAKTLRPDSSVYAFEPVKRVFNKLRANNNLNNYNIHCNELAVSNYDGEGVFYDSASEHTYSVTINKQLITSSTIETKISTITLDSFIEINQLQKIDLLKIDVESHEVEVLQGFERYIKQFKPSILIEILFEEVGLGVAEIIKDLNYLYFHVDEEKGVRQTEKLIPIHPHYNYLLCTEEVAKTIKLIF